MKIPPTILPAASAALGYTPPTMPMTRHFSVLIPSTNTTVEMECRLLDEGIDYQSPLLRTAKVEKREGVL